MTRDPRPAERRRVLAVCGLLLLAVGLVFGQTVRHQFVNLDDGEYVSENPHFSRGATGDGLLWPLTQRHHHNWCPLTWWSYMLDYQLCGLKPWGYHLTNVLLHAANAVLLFLVLRRMTGRLWPSALAAALFAVHPLRAESVAWVAERKDVLSGLFFMLTLWAYAGYARARGVRRGGDVRVSIRGGVSPSPLFRYLAVLALFSLGLMAKPMLVTLPFVLLLLDFWPLVRMNDTKPRSTIAPAAARSSIAGLTEARSSIAALWGLIVEKIPLLALAAVACGLTLWAQRDLVMPSDSLPFYWRIGNALVSYAAYLRQFFVPTGLALWYPLLISNLQTWKVLACFGLLTAVTVATVYGWRRCPYVLVGWLWYLGMLVPAIGLVQVTSQAMADRFTYLPQIGICIAVAWGACRVRETHRDRATDGALHAPCQVWLCGGVAAFAVAVLMACAWRQTSFWRDSETLFSRTLDCTSQNALAQNNLGIALANLGRPDEAMSHYRKAIEIQPTHAEAHRNLGAALVGQRRLDEALAHLREALRLQPDDALAHHNIGIALAASGRLDEAILHYRKALEIRPHYAEGHYNFGIALAACGRWEEAIGHYRKALELRSDFAEAHYRLGQALAARGQLDEAISHYRKALELRPDFVEAHDHLAQALAALGRPAEAIAHYERALELRPESAEAHRNLGSALAACGRSDEALRHYGKALQIRPDDVETVNNLAWELATCPKASLRNGAEAVRLARRAEQLTGGKQPAMLDTLAAAYAEAGQFPEAVAVARRALKLAIQKHDLDVAKELRLHLALYESQKPFHEASPGPLAK